MKTILKELWAQSALFLTFLAWATLFATCLYNGLAYEAALENASWAFLVVFTAFSALLSAGILVERVVDALLKEREEQEV